MLHDDVFSALADPTRRSILETLLHHESLTAGQLAEQFPQMSRPAVSRHLRVLREAELLKESKKGREVYYRLYAQSLQDMDLWLRRFWDQRLIALKRLIEEDMDIEDH